MEEELIAIYYYNGALQPFPPRSLLYVLHMLVFLSGRILWNVLRLMGGCNREMRSDGFCGERMKQPLSRWIMA